MMISRYTRLRIEQVVRISACQVNRRSLSRTKGIPAARMVLFSPQSYWAAMDVSLQPSHRFSTRPSLRIEEVQIKKEVKKEAEIANNFEKLARLIT